MFLKHFAKKKKNTCSLCTDCVRLQSTKEFVLKEMSDTLVKMVTSCFIEWTVIVLVRTGPLTASLENSI